MFGFPDEIVSDNGPPFSSEKFNNFCVENNVKHTLTPPYHSQSNGSAERAVQSIKSF
jgi:transposase InsO family protein